MEAEAETEPEPICIHQFILAQYRSLCSCAARYDRESAISP